MWSRKWANPSRIASANLVKVLSDSFQKNMLKGGRSKLGEEAKVIILELHVPTTCNTTYIHEI